MQNENGLKAMTGTARVQSTPSFRTIACIGVSMVVLALAGCKSATPPPRATPAPRPAAIIPPSPLPPALPYAPGSAAVTQALPPRDMVSGSWSTPNSNLSAEQSLWHLRIGLNVAALGCRGMAYEQALIDNYNAFQKVHQTNFVKAERAVIKELGVKTGTNGIAARDKLSTRLYNYFAQPPVQRDFCPVAYDVSTRALATPPADIFTFAQANMPMLEQPFQNFYTGFAKYQADYARYPDDYRAYQNNLAAWNAQYSPKAPVPEQAPQMALPTQPVATTGTTASGATPAGGAPKMAPAPASAPKPAAPPKKPGG
jgi:hypothetical protein